MTAQWCLPCNLEAWQRIPLQHGKGRKGGLTISPANSPPWPPIASPSCPPSSPSMSLFRYRPLDHLRCHQISIFHHYNSDIWATSLISDTGGHYVPGNSLFQNYNPHQDHHDAHQDHHDDHQDHHDHDDHHSGHQLVARQPPRRSRPGARHQDH